MRQTLKHVAIFLAFLALAALGAEAEPFLEKQIRLDVEPLLLVWIFALAAVILWHLLYHYLGKLSDAAAYTVSVVIVAAVVALAVLDVVRFY
jgi:hypothetical protein